MNEWCVNIVRHYKYIGRLYLKGIIVLLSFICKDNRDSMNLLLYFLDYDYRDQITEKLEHVTPTVSVKTYGSLGKSW